MRRMAGSLASAVAALVCAGLAASPAAARSTAGVAGTTAGPGAQEWVARYPGYGDAHAVAVSPNGRTVFVTGQYGLRTDSYLTIAYNATTGAWRWGAHYRGGAAHAIALSPDGRTVYVTGFSRGAATSYITVAYNAATGAQRWAERYTGVDSRLPSAASSLAVSPSGRMVFVTGQSTGKTGSAFATVAYNAATGARVWVRRHTNPRGVLGASSIGVSPGGRLVFVTGQSRAGKGAAFTTLAYRAATGARLWTARYDSAAHQDDQPVAVTVNPSGTTVFVAGSSGLSTYASVYMTVAYNAANGAQRWATSDDGAMPSTPNDADALGVSPDGKTVYITGQSTVDGDFATIAYDAAAGAELWASAYNGPDNGFDAAGALAVSPRGHAVFVVGGAQAHGEPSFTAVAYHG